MQMPMVNPADSAAFSTQDVRSLPSSGPAAADAAAFDTHFREANGSPDAQELRDSPAASDIDAAEKHKQSEDRTSEFDDAMGDDLREGVDSASETTDSAAVHVIPIAANPPRVGVSSRPSFDETPPESSPRALTHADGTLTKRGERYEVDGGHPNRVAVADHRRTNTEHSNSVGQTSEGPARYERSVPPSATTHAPNDRADAEAIRGGQSRDVGGKEPPPARDTGEGLARDGHTSSSRDHDDRTPAEARAARIELAIATSRIAGPTAATKTVGTAKPLSVDPSIPVPAHSVGPSASAAPNAGSATRGGFETIVSGTSEVEATPANRIIRSMHTMLHHRGGAMSMRLDPPELGTMRVQMNINNGNVSARFEVQTLQAHMLLNENLALLKTSLESQGLHVERLQVVHHSTVDPSAQGRSNDSGQHGSSQSDRNNEQFADAGEGESRGRRDEHDDRSQRHHASRRFDQTFASRMSGTQAGTTS